MFITRVPSGVSLRSDEGLSLETSVSESLYGGQFTLSTQLIKPNYPMVYHERVLYNYFIPCHRKYSSHHNQCDIHAAHDGKVECNAVEYTMAFVFISSLMSIANWLRNRQLAMCVQYCFRVQFLASYTTSLSRNRYMFQIIL